LEIDLDKLPETELYRFAKEIKRLVARKVPRYSSKYSRKDYTLRQHAVLVCLKIKKEDTYREIADETIEMTRIRRELKLNKVPHPSTLCRAFNKLSMKTWRALLKLSMKKLDLSGVTGIDASGFDMSYASRHYTKRAEMKLSSLKTTLLVDASGAIVDLHITTTRKHDTRIASPIVKRNSKLIDVLLGDKGYDDQKLRELCLEKDIKPIIKYKEFTEEHKKLNQELEVYGRRNINECVNSSLKRKYGSHVRSRSWWKQFREITVKCLVQNVEKTINYLALLSLKTSIKFKRVAT